ncbi:RNA pol II promoter Fmp27 protein domain family protein [Candida albicans]|uniref:RNA pol II promoter Fmp27 protein domain family protein n=1 Tax=Candida albicans TaxID=5476 RepID=A0A8H6BXM5_CANAX|nr:RNA pol II promoter Fmp27 protein domain family protein [Candida albicans]
MDKFQIDISKPKFNIDEVANFIYDFGQGVPKTTEYTLLIPMYMALQLGELRMHLRDYPLPLLHSPRNKDMDETSFKLNGHLVISEAFAKAIEHMRQIDVPLVPEHKHKHNS